MKRWIALLGLCLTLIGSLLVGGRPVLAAGLISPAPEGALAYFIAPEDGATLQSPFTVKFGLVGMGIAPAGVEVAGTGHHHLLVDVETLPDLKASLPKTEQIKHYGGGQTEAQLTLPPGQHTLQLLLGNYVHIPHEQPVLSDKITITVE